MNSLEDMRKKYEELGEAIKRLEDQEQQPAEWPQVGDTYFFWDTRYGLGEAEYRTHPATYGRDAELKLSGNMHRTKEEAEAYRAFRTDARTVMRDKIQMWVDEYNGGERGYYFFIKNVIGEWVVAPATTPNPFATKDRKGAELILNKFGLDNIIWACGGPEPGGE